MKEHMKNKLRQWALMGDVLINNHYSHERRWQRVEVLKRLIILETQEEKNSALLPLWATTLLAILDASRENTGTYSSIDHTEARNTLRLFVDTCNFIIQKWDEFIWYSWMRECYDSETGERLMPPLRNNVFVNLSTSEMGDSVPPQPIDDIPW